MMQHHAITDINTAVVQGLVTDRHQDEVTTLQWFIIGY
jgi:hypothetical protein